MREMRKKMHQSKENRETACNINDVVRVRLIEKLALEKDLKEIKCELHDSPGKRAAGRGSSKYQGAERGQTTSTMLVWMLREASASG